MSENPKHTPGPWWVNKEDPGEDTDIMAGDPMEGDETVVVARIVDGNEVDAALLAAAPDLKDQLAAVVDYLTRLRDGKIHDKEWPAIDEAIDDANTLIRKAEGKQ